MANPYAPGGGGASTSSLAGLQSQYGTGMPSAGAGAAPSAGSASQVPLIYLGQHKTSAYDPTVGITYSGTTPSYAQVVKRDKISTADQVQAQFESMSLEKQRNTLRLLAIAGLTNQSVDLADVDEYVKQSTLDDAIGAYANLLELAGGYYAGGLKVTPDDVLKSRLGYRLKNAGYKWNGDLHAFDGGAGSAFGKADETGAGSTGSLTPQPGTYTTTAKSVDFLNPQDAKNLVRGTLQEQLGRDPTQGEYEDFLSAIHAAEAQNPSTSSTTSKYELDKNEQLRLASQHTTTQQGIGAAGLQQVAYERAQKQPGWAEWQAMGTYAPALFAALGSSVPGV